MAQKVTRTARAHKGQGEYAKPNATQGSMPRKAQCHARPNAMQGIQNQVGIIDAATRPHIGNFLDDNLAD